MTTFTDITTTSWDDALGAIERGYELGWSDGLPIVPPTTARVAEFRCAKLVNIQPRRIGERPL